VRALPPDAVAYKRTAEFSESTVPAGLRSRHTTRAGVWARIRVIEGELRYRILEPNVEEHLLRADAPGIVEPEVPHELEVVGPVRFFVEFLRRQAARQ
jgi:tellurite resistance-related uncharacterized protein